MNPFYALPLHFRKIHLNIIPPSTPIPSKQSHSFIFHIESPYELVLAMRVSDSAQFMLLDLIILKHIQRNRNYRNFHYTVCCSPFFLLLRSNSTRQQLLLEHCQSVFFPQNVRPSFNPSIAGETTILDTFTFTFLRSKYFDERSTPEGSKLSWHLKCPQFLRTCNFG